MSSKPSNDVQKTPSKKRNQKSHNEASGSSTTLTTPSKQESLITETTNSGSSTTFTTPSKQESLITETTKTPSNQDVPRTPSFAQASGSSSTFTSPSSKGVGESLNGYLVSVGAMEKSKKGNSYYRLLVQVSKTQLITIMIMDQPRNPQREQFTPHCTASLHFTKVYPGDGGYFYSAQQNSRWKVGEELSFSIDDLTTSLKIINVKRAGAEFHVKAAMKWLGEVDTANNGSRYRSAMLADFSGNIKLTVWKTAWFDLPEGIYLFTSLKLREYFGLYLATTGASTYADTKEQIVANWPEDFEEMLPKKETNTMIDCEINSVTLNVLAFCPSCDNTIVYSDQDGIDCQPCGKTLKSKKCRLQVMGSMDVEAGDTQEVISLTIDGSIIDNIFGCGTVKRYANKIRDLKLMLLQLEDLEVVYNVESRKVTSIKMSEEPVKKKNRIDNDESQE